MSPQKFNLCFHVMNPALNHGIRSILFYWSWILKETNSKWLCKNKPAVLNCAIQDAKESIPQSLPSNRRKRSKAIQATSNCCFMACSSSNIFSDFAREPNKNCKSSFGMVVSCSVKAVLFFHSPYPEWSYVKI